MWFFFLRIWNLYEHHLVVALKHISVCFHVYVCKVCIICIQGTLTTNYKTKQNRKPASKSLALQWISKSKGKNNSAAFFLVRPASPVEQCILWAASMTQVFLMLNLATLWFSVPLSRLYWGSLEVVTPLWRGGVALMTPLQLQSEEAERRTIEATPPASEVTSHPRVVLFSPFL